MEFTSGDFGGAEEREFRRGVQTNVPKHPAWRTLENVLMSSKNQRNTRTHTHTYTHTEGERDREKERERDRERYERMLIRLQKPQEFICSWIHGTHVDNHALGGLIAIPGKLITLYQGM